jgi:hypothetical protein
MQSLVDAVRASGATQPLLVTGNAYGDDLNQWLAFKPVDPLNSLIASVHKYNFSACITASGAWTQDGPTCWENMIRPLAVQVPVVSAELGEDDCAHEFIDSFMNWMDSIGAGYLGWSWFPGVCGEDTALITDYSGAPTRYGIGLRDHLLKQTGS